MANLCIAIAALLLFPIAVMLFEARPVSGEYAMGLVVVPLLELLQWVALTGALLSAAHRGRLAWLHQRRSVQAIVGGGWLALLGVAATAAVFMAYDPISAPFRLWSVVLALLVPMVTLLALGVHVNGTTVPGTALGWRVGAAALSFVVAAGGFAMLRVGRTEQQQHQVVQAMADSAQSAQHDALRRNFDGLAPDAPLAEWLPWLDVSDDELQKLALAAIRRRPTLNHDVAVMLQSEQHAPSALRFLWLWMPSPPAELAAPTRDAIANLSAWAERRVAKRVATGNEATSRPQDSLPRVRAVDLDDVAQAAIVLADAFRSSGLDFVTPIRVFASTLKRLALPEPQFADDVTYQPRAYLDTWLKGRDSKN